MITEQKRINNWLLRHTNKFLCSYVVSQYHVIMIRYIALSIKYH